MLRNFYRNLVYLAGDLTTTFFGRIANRTDDDLAMLNDFAVNAAGTTKPRSVVVYGSGFSEWMTGQGFSASSGRTSGPRCSSGVYRTLLDERARRAAVCPGGGQRPRQRGRWLRTQAA